MSCEGSCHEDVWGLIENWYLWLMRSNSEMFVLNQIKEIKWGDVGGWTGQGGSLLGTKRWVHVGKSSSHEVIVLTFFAPKRFSWILCYLPPHRPHVRTLPGKHLEEIAEQLRIHNINALLVIGGFEVSQDAFCDYAAFSATVRIISCLKITFNSVELNYILLYLHLKMVEMRFFVV